MKGTLVGVFSNRKLMLAAIEHLLADCYLRGERKNCDVTENNVGRLFVKKLLNIYKGDDVFIKIWDITTNTINPDLAKNKANTTSIED